MLGKQQNIDLDYIRRVVSLSMILSRYGLQETLKVSGTQLKGACPVHGGSNRRQFVVDTRKNVWRCFADCNRGGGVLELVAALEHVDIMSAARLVAGWFAISSPPQPTPRRDPMSDKNARPSHKVFVVEDRGEHTDAFWTRIGSAWPNKDGKGFNIALAALPINGRLVLREFTDEDLKEEEVKSKTRRR